MKFNDLARDQFKDIDNLNRLLKGYVDSYRLLVASAAELYNINMAKKSDIKNALDRVDDVGQLIDSLILSLNKCQNGYLKYCKIKNDYLNVTSSKNQIYTEIDNELNFQNGRCDDDDDE